MSEQARLHSGRGPKLLWARGRADVLTSNLRFVYALHRADDMQAPRELVRSAAG